MFIIQVNKKKSFTRKVNVCRDKTQKYTLREQCLNTEFFLVRIFSPDPVRMRETPYISVFSSNAGKYGPEKTPYLDTFHAVIL